LPLFNRVTFIDEKLFHPAGYPGRQTDIGLRIKLYFTRDWKFLFDFNRLELGYLQAKSFDGFGRQLYLIFFESLLLSLRIWFCSVLGWARAGSRNRPGGRPEAKRYKLVTILVWVHHFSSDFLKLDNWRYS